MADAGREIVWTGRDGAEIACVEKRAVLAENLAEFDQVLRDLFEDAVLMGVDEAALRRLLAARIDRLASPLRR